MYSRPEAPPGITTCSLLYIEQLSYRIAQFDHIWCFRVKLLPRFRSTSLTQERLLQLPVETKPNHRELLFEEMSVKSKEHLFKYIYLSYKYSVAHAHTIDNWGWKWIEMLLECLLYQNTTWSFVGEFMHHILIFSFPGSIASDNRFACKAQLEWWEESVPA